MRMGVQSLASFSELRIQHGHELPCRLKSWLGSGIAMAVANASSNSTPSLRTSMCLRCSPRKKKKKKRISAKTFGSKNDNKNPLFPFSFFFCYLNWTISQRTLGFSKQLTQEHLISSQLSFLIQDIFQL